MKYFLGTGSFFIKLPFMFIPKVPYKNRKNRKEYYTYKLVESIRTEREPRQRDILKYRRGFHLPREQWKDLANCIEKIITGKVSFQLPNGHRDPC